MKTRASEIRRVLANMTKHNWHPISINWNAYNVVHLRFQKEGLIPYDMNQDFVFSFGNDGGIVSGQCGDTNYRRTIKLNDPKPPAKVAFFYGRGGR